jgi:hypothetical protein
MAGGTPANPATLDSREKRGRLRGAPYHFGGVV